MSVKISVLMPNYNYGRFIGEAIQSILNQDFEDFELIISDNCSTDNSIEKINNFLGDKRIKFFKQKENLGIFGNYNFLLKKAIGEYIYILPSDDFINSNTLGFLFDSIQKYNKDFISINRTLYKDGLNNEISLFNNKKNILLEKTNVLQYILLENKHFIPGMFILKNVFKDNFYNFDENLEDDMICRFFLRDYKGIHLDKNGLYFMRVHGNNYGSNSSLDFLTKHINNTFNRLEKYKNIYLKGENKNIFNKLINKMKNKNILQFNFHLIFLKLLKFDFKTAKYFFNILKKYNSPYSYFILIIKLPYLCFKFFYDLVIKKDLV